MSRGFMLRPLSPFPHGGMGCARTPWWRAARLSITACLYAASTGRHSPTPTRSGVALQILLPSAILGMPSGIQRPQFINGNNPCMPAKPIPQPSATAATRTGGAAFQRPQFLGAQQPRDQVQATR